MSKREAMTKAELVEEVAAMTDLTKKRAEMIVKTVFESMVHSLRLGESIELRGFGSFRIRQRGPGPGVIRDPESRWMFPPRRFPTSSRARSSRSS